MLFPPDPSPNDPDPEVRLDAALCAADENYGSRVYIRRANLLIIQDNLWRARDILTAGRTLYPDHPRILTNLGNVYRRMGMPGMGFEPLEASLKLNPNDSVAHHVLAMSYMEMGLHEKCKDSLDKVCILEPDNTYVHAELADLHMLQGDQEQAFQKVWDFQNNHPKYVDGQLAEAKYNFWMGQHEICSEILYMLYQAGIANLEVDIISGFNLIAKNSWEGAVNIMENLLAARPYNELFRQGLVAAELGPSRPAEAISRAHHLMFHQHPPLKHAWNRDPG